MIDKLSKHIDKTMFITNVIDQIKKFDKIVFDSFISNICNLNCSHCYFGDYKPTLPPLSLKKWSKVIDECIDNGIRHFHFSGKEPFCDTRILHILSKLNRSQIRNDLFYGLVTNGTVIRPNDCNTLLDTHISYLEISLEGDENYDYIIRGKTHFQIVATLIDKINNKCKVNLTSTITNNNLNHLICMIRQMVNKGVTKFNLAPLLLFDKHILAPVKELEASVMLDLSRKCYNLLTELQNLNEQIDIRICFTQKQAYELFVNKNFLSPYIESHVYDGQDLVFNVGKHIIEINYPLLYIPYLSQLIATHDGYIIPCADDIHYTDIRNISIGNIAKDSISQILLNRENFIMQYMHTKLS